MMSDPIHLDVQQISDELRIRPEIYLKIAVSFVNSLDGKMKTLSEALFDNNRDQMRMILHEIKGTAGNLRLKNISAVEAAMHEAVKAGEPQARLSQHFEALRAEALKTQMYFHSLSR